MPTYTLRQHDNGVHYIHWTDENRRSKRVSTGEKEEVAAQIFLGEWLKLEPDSRGETPQFVVSDLWTFYQKQHLEKNTTDGRASVGAALTAHFGALLLPAVARPDKNGVTKVDEYVAMREDGEYSKRNHPAAPATIRGELALLKACFHWCADPKRKLILPSDIPLFDLPPDSPARDRWLSAEEIQRMTSAATELLAEGVIPATAVTFLWLALETAARRGAILQLVWPRVDFVVGNIDYRVPGQRVTKKRRAIVPIPTALRPVLTANSARVGDRVCGDLTSGMCYYYLKRIAARAGVEGVSPHVLRHTAATHMLRNGVPIWIVAGILGDTVTTVERVYGHHIPSGLAAGVEMISGAIKPTVETAE